MSSCSIFLLVVVGCVVVIVFGAMIASAQESAMLEKMSPEERARYLETKKQKAAAAQAAFQDAQHGPINSQMICPHCQTRGTVRTKKVLHKKGVSGGKAAAAVLTAGVSVLATGLSRKEGVTEARCQNCGSTWHF